MPDRVAAIRARCAAAVARGGHGQSVRLIAVTKTYGPEAVEAAWAAGVTDVGENRVQEAVEKQAMVQAPVAWHLIGHLQRNKAKAVDRFALVHGVDSARLADAIDVVGRTRGTPVDVLLQVNVVGEASKGGLAPAEVDVEAARWLGLSGLRVRGVMTMAPLEAEERVLRQVFAGARAALAQVRQAGHAAATELSMGMSGDFEIAVEEGATMVRLGTILFGARA
ncbi:MAG: YggS family pyridoxal phosphate-dependent enzyme [Gemmatimonadaceae bacterium]|nr:YggS family pyridoxal phosphate-dependent enzyme [Gemmatimonadaceae bacterium]